MALERVKFSTYTHILIGAITMRLSIWFVCGLWILNVFTLRVKNGGEWYAFLPCNALIFRKIKHCIKRSYVPFMKWFFFYYSVVPVIEVRRKMVLVKIYRLHLLEDILIIDRRNWLIFLSEFGAMRGIHMKVLISRRRDSNS